MPKLTPERQAARRQRILDAARQCFIARGFDATTIQHICAAAGVSAGGIYTWFASKHAIVEALAAEALAAGTPLVGHLRAGPPGPDSAGARLGALAAHLLTDSAAQADARLDLRLWAAGVGDEGIGAGCRDSVDALRAALSTIAADAQAAGRLDPALAPSALGAVLSAVAMGLEVQRALGVALDADAVCAAVRRLVQRGWAPEGGGAA